MPIHLLSDDLVSKIAAGEVIERPASVVKELIENSIDAGAREIKIEIRGGGQRLIRVSDDGCGIPAAEVALAFARHATSKLNSVDDLFRLQTLGFRGEALPSIAAVSRVTLITRARAESVGTQMRVEGGKIIEQRAQGAPAGTIVTVEDLFRYVPARLKFLKTPATETARIVELVHAYAMAFPALHFSLVSDDRLLFQSPGTGALFDVLVKVFGIEVASQMLHVSPSGFQKAAPPASDLQPETFNLQPETLQVTGFVSPPSLTRATRKYMFFFVNHRWVQDHTLQHAVIEAYHTALMVGRLPMVMLDIVLPSDAVDVNVHPAKSQVRFRDAQAVFRAVQYAVRATLTAHAPIPNITFTHSVPTDERRATNDTQRAIELQRPLPTTSHPSPSDAASISNLQSSALPMLRVLGQILSTYIIAEGPDGLYLIDQHAAHERVLYEQLMAEHASATIATQALLEPLVLHLTPAQAAALETHRTALESVGFQFEDFGAHTLLLRAVPAAMRAGDPREALARILDELEQGEMPLEKSAEAHLIASVCRGIAVRGGQVLSLEEMRELVRRLEQTSAPRTCPHGRPTMIQLSIGQLQKEFGRK
jgi:DNA mismatch repair protein MutL